MTTVAKVLLALQPGDADYSPTNPYKWVDAESILLDPEVLAGLGANYALGGGSSRMITGPTLPTLPVGTEYVWNKTDGAGTLLDILTGVA